MSSFASLNLSYELVAAVFDAGDVSNAQKSFCLRLSLSGLAARTQLRK